MLRYIGHHVNVHKITPAVGNEHTDIEIKVYVVLTRGRDTRLHPRPLVLDFTMMYDRCGRSKCTPSTCQEKKQIEKQN